MCQGLKRSTDKLCPVAGYVELVIPHQLIPQEGKFSGFSSQCPGKHGYRTQNLMTHKTTSFSF